jgi:hypothetical protein
VETIQKKCSTPIEEKRSGLEGETLAGVTSEPGGGYYLIAQEVESRELQEEIVQYLYY